MSVLIIFNTVEPVSLNNGNIVITLQYFRKASLLNIL